MSVEADTLAKLKANQDSAIAALQRGDMAALEALAIHEAQLMDVLRAIWSQQR
jgi:hypothetical protein